MQGIKKIFPLVAIFISLNAFGGNNIFKLDSVQAAPGQIIDIDVSIDNDDSFISFQLDIPLPTGFTYVPGSAQLNPQRVTDHILSTNILTGNILRLVAISFNNSPFIGNSGPVAVFELNSPTTPGMHELPILNYVIGDISGVNICTGVVYGAINLLGPLSVDVSASPDAICAGEAVQLSSQITGGGWNPILQWSSVPPGFSSNDPAPLVFPLENIEYILTVNDGNQIESSSVLVTVGQSPTANAGSSFAVCIGDEVNLSGTATNYTTVLWEGGSGTFTNPNSLSTTYTPHPDDYVNSPIVLSLTASGSPLCPNATSNLSVSFISPPQVNAGNNSFVHSTNTHQIEGATAQNYTSLIWQSAGDGSFSDPSILLPVYTPGAQDITNGSATLSLTANPESPCSATIDSKQLFILSGNDNTMHLQGGTADINDTIVIYLTINNKYDFTSFNCVIDFPEQMTYLLGSAEFTGREGDHQLDIVNEANTLSITASSPTNETFSGSSGHVIQFELATGELEGLFPINLIEASILEPQDHFDILTATVDGQINIIITSLPKLHNDEAARIQMVQLSHPNGKAIKLSLLKQADVRFLFYDITGRFLHEKILKIHSSGTHTIELNQIINIKNKFNRGIYILRVIIDDPTQTSASFKIFEF